MWTAGPDMGHGKIFVSIAECPKCVFQGDWNVTFMCVYNSAPDDVSVS